MFRKNCGLYIKFFNPLVKSFMRIGFTNKNEIKPVLQNQFA
jgi:hypothetical protein